MNLFECVKEQISFEDVARDHDIEFNRSGRALCPFHDDHDPSLSLHRSREYAYCFTCGESLSDVIEVEYKLGNHPNRWEAAKALNERYSLGLQFNGYDRERAEEHEKARTLLTWYCEQVHKKLSSNENALSFLKSKGATEEDVKRYKIGNVGDGWLKGKVTPERREIALKLGLLKENNGQFYDWFRMRITFPVWQRGRIVSIHARKFPDDGNPDNPKWIGLPTSEFIPHKPIAWGENLNCERCVITEAIPDAMAFLKLGIPACALLGKESSDDNRKYFERAKAKLCFALDPDEAGRKTSYKLACEFKGYMVDLGYDKDADEVLAELGPEKFGKLVEKAIDEATFYLDAVIEREDDYKEALKEIIKLKFEGEKERWLRRLSEKTGVSIRALKADLKIIEAQGEKKTESEEGDDEPVEEIVALFDGLVDLVEQNGEVAFLIKTGDEVEVVKSVDRDGIRRVPPPKDQIPFLLPRADEVLRHYRTDSDEALYDDLVGYHKGISELPSERHYHLLTAWDFHTYVLDLASVQYSPYLWLFAIPVRGKSRTGKGMVYVGYRGIHVESLRDAYIVRVANNFRSMLFIDVRNLWKKAERAGSEDIILLRFEKGVVVARVLNPDRGPFKDTTYFEIYGATVIGTNEPVHPALETRAITVTMPESSKKFEEDVRAEMGLPLKERLVSFRARHLGEELPIVEKPIQGRLGDITKPLLQIVKLVKPENENLFRKLIKEIDEERRIQESDSYEAKLLSIIIELEGEVADGLLPIKQITDTYNETVSDRFKTSTNKVGWRFKAMGFKKTRRNDGSYIEWNKALIERLSLKFGLVDEDEPQVDAEGAQKEETTPPHTSEKRHERHDHHLFNDDSELDSDVSSDEFEEPGK